MGISWYTEPYLTRTRIVGAGTEVLSESVRFWTSIPPGRISQSIGLESAFVGGAGGGLVLVLSIFPPFNAGSFFWIFFFQDLQTESRNVRSPAAARSVTTGLQNPFWVHTNSSITQKRRRKRTEKLILFSALFLPPPPPPNRERERERSQIFREN